MTADEKTRIDRSEWRLRKYIFGFVTVVVTCLAVAGFFAINQHFAHEDAKHVSAVAACHSVQKVKDALVNITEHSKNKSIQNVKAGVTSSTTTVKEVKAFYDNAVKEIKEIECEGKAQSEHGTPQRTTE